MQARNEYLKASDSSYLEVNPEHLARFLRDIDWDVELDSSRAWEFLSLHNPSQEKMERRATAN